MIYVLKIQSFLKSIQLTSMSLIKLFFLSNLMRFRFPKKNISNRELLILGNGPALIKDINEINNLNSYDKLAVNHFAESVLYCELKPSYYCINAPELFLDSSDDETEKRRDILFNSLVLKTSWNITLLVINAARKESKWKNIIAMSPNIKVTYYNTNPFDGFKFVKYFIWRYNLGLPAPHNVIIPSIILAINENYKVINLLGVDHSWLKEIIVQDDNLVLLNQKHFYDHKESKLEPMRKGITHSRKLHEILHKFYHAFKGYHEIEDFALAQNVQIYNLTSESYIDAFKRK